MLDQVQVFLKSGRNIRGVVSRNDLRVLQGSLWIYTVSDVVIVPICNVDMIKSIQSMEGEESPVTYFDPDLQETLSQLDKFDGDEPMAKVGTEDMPLAVVSEESAMNPQEQLQARVDAGPPQRSSTQDNYSHPVAIVADATVPESVRKAEKLARESKTNVTSDELAPYLADMDDAEYAQLVVTVADMYDQGLSMEEMIRNTGLTENEIRRMLFEADRSSD